MKQTPQQHTFTHRMNLAALGMERNKNGGSSWTVRRRIIGVTLAFCAGCVCWITYKGTDTETARTIVSSAFYLAGAVVMSYIGGATWDDKNKINAIVSASGVTPAPSGTSNSSMPAGDPPAGG